MCVCCACDAVLCVACAGKEGMALCGGPVHKTHVIRHLSPVHHTPAPPPPIGHCTHLCKQGQCARRAPPPTHTHLPHPPAHTRRWTRSASHFCNTAAETGGQVPPGGGTGLGPARSPAGQPGGKHPGTGPAQRPWEPRSGCAAFQLRLGLGPALGSWPA